MTGPPSPSMTGPPSTFYNVEAHLQGIDEAIGDSVNMIGNISSQMMMIANMFVPRQYNISADTTLDSDLNPPLSFKNYFFVEAEFVDTEITLDEPALANGMPADMGGMELIFKRKDVEPNTVTVYLKINGTPSSFTVGPNEVKRYVSVSGSEYNFIEV